MPPSKLLDQKTKSKPLSIDPMAAQAAFDKLLPRLEKIPLDDLQAPRTGVDMAAIFALGVADELSEHAFRLRAARLPKEFFDIRVLDDLRPAALAAWHAATQLLAANAHGAEAKLPVDLVSEANDVKSRMLRVADYHFDADTLQGREVADIRIGTGYRDLAQDLLRLAKLYRLSEARLIEDRIWYRADDAERANALAQKILRALGESRSADQKLWAERVQRAWALLVSLYEDATATAAWLQRHDPEPKLYTSIYAAGRAPQRRPRSFEQDADDESKI